MTLAFPVATASLLLRPYEEDDFEAFADLVGRADVTRFLPWGPRDRASAREAFDRRRKELAPDADGRHLPLAVIDRASRHFAGEAGLIRIDHNHRGGEIGYMLHPAFQGRGLMVEAANAVLDVGFGALGLHRIHGICDERNVASARVMEKLGMRREGHWRSNAWFKGEWTSALVYAILEDEWRTGRG